MKYNGPHNIVTATRVSRATLQRKQEQLGQPYPVPFGEPLGGYRLTDESVALGVYDHLPLKEVGRPLYWVRVDAAAEALPDGPPVLVDGVPTVPARTGVEKPDTDFDAGRGGPAGAPAPRPVPRG